MDLRGRNITVIGAGIGGLAAALALRAQGADVTVLEQAPGISEVGAGLQISPNGAAVLRALGLESGLAAQAVAARAVVLKDYRRAGAVLRLDLDRYAADQSFYFVHRADLIDLLAGAARTAGVRVRLLQQVRAVQPGPTPVIAMQTGADLRPDLVVGADGLHSNTRVALNGADDAFFTGQVAWRATIPASAPVPPEARLFMAPHRHLVTYPLRGGAMINLVAVQARAAWTEESWSLADDPAQMRAAFGDFGAEAQTLLGAVERVNLWGLFRHPVAPRWHAPGVAIVGDAAHPTLPFLAQGANLALEDAWALARSLAEESMDINAALATYQARRHARASRVIAAANGNAWRYHLANPALRGAAHLALNLGGRIMPGRMVGQFDWLYRHDVTT